MERFKDKSCERYQNRSEEEQNVNMVGNYIKISQKVKKKTQLSIGKHITKFEKIKICYKQRLMVFSFKRKFKIKKFLVQV